MNPEPQTSFDGSRPSNGTGERDFNHEPLRESTDRVREDGAATPTKSVEKSASAVSDAGALRERVDNVLQSEVGVNTLLNRLKQSISSAKDFASFLNRRALLEEEHAQGLKKLSQAEAVRKPESRQDSFAYSYHEIARIYDRMSDQGLAFAVDLHSMSDELHEQASTMERGRKHWKQTGQNAEKRMEESEGAMNKAKAKYYSLADQYERARTGERQSGRFGLKGPKSEDDLLRKVQGADSEYASRVQSAQSQQGELITMVRPQAVKALYDLISECDSAVSLQMQKFAHLNERLLLSNGLCVNPLKGQATGGGPQAKGLREVAQNVNNERDLQEYILHPSNKVGNRVTEIKYERHPVLDSPRPMQPPQYPSQQQFNPSQSQFGQPSQSNVGLGVGYDQGQRYQQPPGGMPYQNRDGQQFPGQFSQQPPGPQSQMSQYNNPPQLPQLDLSMSGAGGPEGSQRPQNSQRPDFNPSMGPNNDHRNIMSPLNQNQTYSQSSQGPQGLQGPQGPPGPNNDYRAANTAPNQNRSASQNMPVGPSSSYQRPGSAGQSGYQSGMLPPVPGQNNYRGAPPPSMRPNEGPPVQSNGYRTDNRGPPTMAPNTNFGSDARGPPLSQNNSYQPDNRGPPLGQNSYQAESRAAPVGASGNNQLQGRPAGPSNGVGANVPNQTQPAAQARRPDVHRPGPPPLNPVFGVSLDELFRRDGAAVPTIVYQCIQAVDLFGLDTEGVYRISGSAPHIMEMRALFDHDSSQVDFRTPASFHNDIASVTTLLKHFLRDLPDPLLTSAQYNSFIQAAKLDDDVVRRDSLHAIINSLPDPNYATLRVLTLHLNRVADHSSRNRMTRSNLAICIGPTLMGHQGAGNGYIKDAELQARVVETILVNALQIFDDDE